MFGIGFKIGFLVAVVGLIMTYMPLMEEAAKPFLQYISFYEVMDSNPLWVRVFATGVMLMVAAAGISVVKGWVEEMADILFVEREDSKPK